MSVFLRQNIVGLLRHAAETLPALRRDALKLAERLRHEQSAALLAAAALLFEEAAAAGGDAIFVTGSHWAAVALAEASSFPRSVDGPAARRERPGPGAPSPPVGACDITMERRDDIWQEAVGGLLDLMERRRRGATLEQALALFPSWGDEWEPCPPSVTTGTN